MKRQVRFVASSVLFAVRIVVFLILLLLGIFLYLLFLEDILLGNHILLTSVGLWLVTAYIILPRVHRRLTKLYLPDYFIGRVRTSDGLLGDPVNLAVIGTKKELISAMEKAGWAQADSLSFKANWRMITSTLLKKSYPTAPVSSLFLFGNKQDLAFQKEVNGNPHARHHVRFWKTPSAWWLPGGHAADFVGAATYDNRVGFSYFTGQFTHKIDENVDEERNFVVKSVLNANRNTRLEKVPHFMTAFRHRNGGGDSISTDGALYFLHLS
jgi:hypothetical protein